MSFITNLFPANLMGIISGDVGFLLAAFIVILGFSFFAGRGSIVSLVISYYPATLLFKTFPFIEKVMFLHGDKLLVFNKIGLFIIFLIPITIVVNRYIFTASDYGGGESMLRLGGLSIAFLILVVLFSYSVVNYDSFHNFSPQIDNLFTIEERQFYWNLAPLALLAVL